MNFSLKAPNGTLIDSYLKNHKEYIKIDGLEYEIHHPVDDFDSDPEIRQMIQASDSDIKQGKLYSTTELLDAIKRGEV